MHQLLYGIAAIVALALGLTLIDSPLVGRPLTWWLVSGLPDDIGRPDIAFQGLDEMTDNGMQVPLAIYRIEGNEYLAPALPLGVRGCDGAADCAADFRQIVARDEAETVIARAILTRFNDCGLPPQALRSVSGYPVELTPSRLEDLPRTGEAWRLTGEVTLDMAVLSDGRAAFTVRLQACSAGLMTEDLGLWTLPESAWIDARIMPLDPGIAMPDAPLLTAWRLYLREQNGTEMRLDPRSIQRAEATPSTASTEPLIGTFSVVRDEDETAVREAIRDWMRGGPWDGRADRLADFISSSINVRPVSDDAAVWRMLVRVTTEDSDPADLAITYNTETRVVSDIVMVNPFGDIRTRDGADWPPDGSLYLP